jgi:exodeoxyribonuclease V alpha subunit
MAKITIKCLHEKTLFINEESGYTVASYKTGDGSAIPHEARSKYQTDIRMICFTAVGTRIPTTEGAEIELTGKWTDGKYGKQFSVTNCSVARPQTVDGIVAYLSSDLVKGIGNQTAKAIVAKFGIETFNIIDTAPYRLLEIPGITEKKLVTIMEGYQENIGLRDIMASLADYGVTPKKAEKILAKFGVQAAEIINANPYALCKINGFGFKTVDKMARTKGIPPDNPQRILEGIMYTISQSQQSGHLFLTSSELCNEALKLLGKKDCDNHKSKIKSNSRWSKRTAVLGNSQSRNGKKKYGFRQSNFKCLDLLRFQSFYKQ